MPKPSFDRFIEWKPEKLFKRNMPAKSRICYCFISKCFWLGSKYFYNSKSYFWLRSKISNHIQNILNMYIFFSNNRWIWHKVTKTTKKTNFWLWFFWLALKDKSNISYFFFKCHRQNSETLFRRLARSNCLMFRGSIKGQEISKLFFLETLLPKKQTILWRISALASKMDQIKWTRALSYVK